MCHEIEHVKIRILYSIPPNIIDILKYYKVFMCSSTLQVPETGRDSHGFLIKVPINR